MNNLDRHTVTYEGDDIYIEEMPQGCFITQVNGKGESVRISSMYDALKVIESLQKMIKIQYGDLDEPLSSL